MWQRECSVSTFAHPLISNQPESLPVVHRDLTARLHWHPVKFTRSPMLDLVVRDALIQATSS